MIYVRRSVKDLLFAFGVACLSLVATADSLVEPAVDRLAPDFIRTSLIVCGPGDMLYSCAGHAALRLTCPHFGLDEVFSYEGEPVRDQFRRFFAGRLKMGMFATPMAEFLQEYHSEGRSVCEYSLELPPAADVRLWKILDQRVAEGPYLPYDYVRRGCAHATLECLTAALSGERVTVDHPPRCAGMTRRDIIHEALRDHPWSRLTIDLIAGPEADRMECETDVVILPLDLIRYLAAVRVDGRPVLQTDDVNPLVPAQPEESSWWNICSPSFIAIVLLVLAIVGCFRGRRAIHGSILALAGALAVFELYICCFSSLPASGWNVLLVPFNPLAIPAWSWRRYWRRPFAAVIVIWCLVMALSPHAMTDPSLIILALAEAIVFAYPFYRRTVLL